MGVNRDTPPLAQLLPGLFLPLFLARPTHFLFLPLFLAGPTSRLFLPPLQLLSLSGSTLPAVQKGPVQVNTITCNPALTTPNYPLLNCPFPCYTAASVAQEVEWSSTNPPVAGWISGTSRHMLKCRPQLDALPLLVSPPGSVPNSADIPSVPGPSPVSGLADVSLVSGLDNTLLVPTPVLKPTNTESEPGFVLVDAGPWEFRPPVRPSWRVSGVAAGLLFYLFIWSDLLFACLLLINPHLP
ncbi:hypothetical protein Q8A73_008440 [Channa argus]|nr:hypothetical protein Q8A73_008440 [Channa argus]